VKVVHLAKRFFGSLSRREPAASDTQWATAQLLPGEEQLWHQMSVADRRHAIGVAREVVRMLGDRADRAVIAAALLHDVGKVDSNLGTLVRVVATVLNRRTGDGRLARYRRHDQIGAELLEAAGSASLTVAWAREHHLPSDRWTVPTELSSALKAADDD
jgi:predicted HD phosphohydrolase